MFFQSPAAEHILKETI